MENKEFVPPFRQAITEPEFEEMVRLGAYYRWEAAGSPQPGDEKADWAAAEFEVLRGFYVVGEPSETFIAK